MASTEKGALIVSQETGRPEFSENGTCLRCAVRQSAYSYPYTIFCPERSALVRVLDRRRFLVVSITPAEIWDRLELEAGEDE